MNPKVFDFGSEYNCIAAVAAISSISVFISSLESLRLREHYKDSGLFAWRIIRTKDGVLLRNPLMPFFDHIFAYPNVLWIFAMRALACVALIPMVHHPAFFIALCVFVSFTTILLSVRSGDGKNGADQMAKMTFTAISLVLLSPHPWVWRCGLLFLSGQLSLAYCTSGYIRIREQTWRDGSALVTILRQHNYGNRWCWTKARQHPFLTQCASRSALLFECTFPLVFVLPIKFCLIFLGFGLVFHLLNAVVIGLNTFLFAFPAIYPAVIWTALFIHKHTGA